MAIGKNFSDYEAQINTMLSGLEDSEVKQLLLLMGFSASKIDKAITAGTVGAMLKKHSIGKFRKAYSVWEKTV